MAPRVAMLLGRTVWIREGGRWNAEAFPAGPAREPAARLAEALSAAPALHTVVVFEPESLSHQPVESPKVDRAGFASLARVRREHPVVEAEDLGWGIEPPETSAGGACATVIHAELTQGLVLIRDALAEVRCPFTGAWSLPTVATALVRARGARTCRWALLATPDYVAVVSLAGPRRLYRSWTGSFSERDGKSLLGVLGEGKGTLASATGGAPGRGPIVAVVVGEPEKIIPAWPELRESGRLEAVLDLDALAFAAARLSRRHPGNLLEAFPRPHSLDPLLAGAALAGCAAACAFALLVLGDRARLAALESAHGQRTVELEGRLGHLDANRRDMERLESQMPEGFGPLPVEMKPALLRLAAAVPDALTLSSFTIGIDRTFCLEALVIGRRFDALGAREAFARSGFLPTKDAGWSFDAAEGRLRVQGRFNEAGP